MTQRCKVCVTCAFQKVPWRGVKGQRRAFGHKAGSRLQGAHGRPLKVHRFLSAPVSSYVSFRYNFYPPNPTDSLQIKRDHECSSTVQNDVNYANVMGYWRETLAWGQGDPPSTMHMVVKKAHVSGCDRMKKWSRDISLPRFCHFLFFVFSLTEPK